MRHPIELAVQQVLPIAAKPRVTADDAASVSRPFAQLLAEAEAVQDVVRLGAAVTPAAPAGALRAAWDFLCARAPWSGLAGLQPAMATPRAERTRRR